MFNNETIKNYLKIIKETIIRKFVFYLIMERLILASDLIRLRDTKTFSDTLSEKNV